ncbi:hypothetical protein RHGRI_032842 [Rhododendron griersonianum]|uniref:CRM domain-containing protein n=1 Tax=Rhododendron griersonianum TaxID=479676 RepID=A0AAV6IFU9_9ERIC|nr:hypothetical protein RHGRI_032842 [Rhododendron griersonianum]
MARLSPSSSHPLLHHFLRPPPPSSLSPLLPPPFLFKPISPLPLRTPQFHPTSSSFISLSSRPLLFPPIHSLSTLRLTTQPNCDDEELELESEGLGLEKEETLTTTQLNYDDEELEIGNEDLGLEKEEDFSLVEERDLDSWPPPRAKELLGVKLPVLSVKEKKDLSSYAHSLGRKLKSQQVGKSGVTESVATALIETLEKNELLKLKIHNNCPGELDDVVKHLEKATGSLVVGQIGRTAILYRPSLTKLKAEEKIEQARKVFRRKQLARKLPFEDKVQRPKLTGRGRRGSSRFSSSPS